jgi:hypothetical protein
MKTLQQNELEIVSGGEWLWRPMLPVPGHLVSPFDGEWLELVDGGYPLVTEVPETLQPICPIQDTDAYES